MRRCRVDALVAASPVSVTYFTDYYCWLDRWFTDYMTMPGASSRLAETFALISLHGEPALILNAIFAANACDIWVQDIQTFGDAGLDCSAAPVIRAAEDFQVPSRTRFNSEFGSASQALIHTIQSRGLHQAAIGIEQESIRPETLAELRNAFPEANFRDCSNLIRLIRMVKTGDELSRLTRAAEISESAGAEILSQARPGLPLEEMAGYYRKRVAEMGADLDHFAFSPRGFGIVTDARYTLRADDVMYIDFGCIFNHCFSDTGCTLALRPLPPELKARFDALRSCIDAGIDSLRPGTLSSSVRLVMQNEFSRYGFQASFPHGHGLGLEGREYPILVDNNSLRIQDQCIDVPSDLPLEKGMVINLEAATFLPRRGSVHFEKTLLITAGGCRPLVPQARDAPFGSRLC